MTMPDGRTKYIGSAYKSYGQPSFLGNLFSRGAPGYRGIKGLSPFGTPTFETRKRPDGTEYYYTEDEKFGETRDAVPFGILGLISALTDRFRKPKDMSEFNKLSLTAPADQKVYMPKGADPSMVINNPFDRLLFADDQGYVSASGTADDVTANLLGVPGTADDVMANLLGLPGSADDPYANLLGVPGTADYYG